MPAIQPLTVNPIDARPGDFYRGITIGNVRDGSKYLTLLDTSDKVIARFPLHTVETIEIQREVPTPEEEEAKERAAAAEKIKWYIEGAISPKALLLAQADNMEDDGTLRYHHIEDLMTATIQWNIAQAIQYVAKIGKAGDLVSSTARVLAEIIYGGRHVNPLRGSTSTMNNLMEAAEHAAAEELLGRWEFGKVVKREVLAIALDDYLS